MDAKKAPVLPCELICKWEWNKLRLSERREAMHCRCYDDCRKLQREKEERIDKAKGFWQRLWANLS